MPTAALVDSNVLVYRFDPRFPDKQTVATDLLRRGLREDTVRLAHQALLEFFAATTRPLGEDPALLSELDARRETEELLIQFPILYPTAEIVRTALRGQATYGMRWFDAHMWAYAECYGMPRLVSEDLQPGRRYGSVRVVNPFAD